MSKLFETKYIDIDTLHERIHDIVDDGLVEQPQSGKTTAMLFMMLAEAQLGDDENVYVYIGEIRDLSKVQANFKRMLEHEQIPFDVDGNMIYTWSRIAMDYRGVRQVEPVRNDLQGQTFIFMTAPGVRSFIGQQLSRAFVDLDYEHFDQVIPTLERYLLPCLQEEEDWVAG